MKWFKCQSYVDRWNKRFAGKPALNNKTNAGHLGGYLLNRQVCAHRIIWTMLTGEQPNGVIDHINGDPSDNRRRNLRCVSHAVNLRNQKMRSTNTSGAMGVRRENNRWSARITANGVERHLGTFDEKSDAIAARKAAERMHGFHQNHGRV